MPRTRDPSVDNRILTAVRQLLAEVGYEGLTMEGVAARAGVGKPSVYRRWPSRAHLMFAAATNDGVPDVLPDTGSWRGDLIEAALGMVRSMQRAPRDVIGEQISAMITDSAFAEHVRRTRLTPDRQRVDALWRRAIERGELPAGFDGSDLLDDLAAVCFYRIFVLHEQLGDDDVTAIVDRHLDGCVRGPENRSALTAPAAEH